MTGHEVMSASIHCLVGFALVLTAACGPGPGTTSATAGTTTDASTTGPGPTTGTTSTTGEPTTSTASATTTSTTGTTTSTTGEPPSTSSSTTGSANPCGCADGELCVQFFDGMCRTFADSCVPNPDGCVPGYPCAPACQPLCDGDSVDACNNSDCPGEIEGAVHCFGI